MPTNLTLLLIVLAVCISTNGVYAFGAGNIPSFAYMEGRAFRHGDIEDTLAELIKRGAGSGGMAVLSSMISKGSKFNGLDIKRVYFGNWLRDYSQAMDIAALKKMPQQTIINLCMVLGFMANGYATNEFEVTPERLGVYLPIEHIDNPKGYGEGEDARKYHPKLRPPVNPRELEIDYHTGMKNYIANEQGGWDTSKALVCRTLERCIHLGRQHRAHGRKEDEYEAYRLLGTSLHTLEDFTAHSNWCELALVSMGHQDVFLHVGDQVRIQAPNGRWVAPIVTGTFGSNDFLHSLLGEATDHLSEASVTDLNKELDRARSVSRGPGEPAAGLRKLLSSLPGGAGSDTAKGLDAMERIRAGPAAGGKPPDQMSPQELHSVLWQVLTFRDGLVKKISMTIENIPGLETLINKIQDMIAVLVFSVLEPILKPLLKTATAGLQEASGEVINSYDQYEVFNDPHASDPTHSFLSKDHFNLILNEPAGQVARVVVTNTVNLVTKAWDDNSININHTLEEILQCLFHPDFHNPNSKVQREMLQSMRAWTQALGPRRQQMLHRLTKNCVRNHENVRLQSEGGPPAAQGSYAQQQGTQMQNTLLGYVNQVPGASGLTSVLGMKPSGPRRDEPGVGGGHGEAAAFHGNETKVQTQVSSYVASEGGGEAASFYGASSMHTQTVPHSPSAPSSYTSYPPSSYAPTTGPPPSFAVAPSAHPGYAPSYSPSYASPPAPAHMGMPDARFSGGGAEHEYSSGLGAGGSAPSFLGEYGPPGGHGASHAAGSYGPPSHAQGGFGRPHSPGGYGPPLHIPGGFGPPSHSPGGLGPSLSGEFTGHGFPDVHADQQHHQHHQHQHQQHQHQQHQRQSPPPQFPGSGPPYQGGW